MLSMAGAPQWFIARGPVYLDTTAAGSNNESGYVALNGVATTSFSVASVGRTITAGPTTTTPILVTVNGVTGYFPYNVLTTMPSPFFNALAAGSQWAIT